jgi:hypothetical protein
MNQAAPSSLQACVDVLHKVGLEILGQQGIIAFSICSYHKDMVEYIKYRATELHKESG